MTMTLIETKTLGTAQAAIDFVSIPQTFTDLMVLISARNSQTDPTDIYAQFNADTGSNYSFRRLFGTGSSRDADSVSGAATAFRIGRSIGSSYTSNTFSNCSFYIPNYTSSTTKSVSTDQVEENNATTSLQLLATCIWSGTVAITSIKLQNLGGSNFAIDTTVSLYGILKGSSNGVVVS